MVENIDRFLIINLNERKDRLEFIMDQCDKIGIPKDKITRIEAVKENPGWRGCSKSHIKTLQLAKLNGWKNIMILEDDVLFTCTKEYLHDTIKECFLNENVWDVVLMNYSLSCVAPAGLQETEEGRKKLKSHYPVTQITNKFYKINNYAVTASCYLINGNYYDKLINNYQESLIVGESLDIHWLKLQQKDIWFLPVPPVGMQRRDYSNIRNTVIDFHF
jgi:GR25 family glycosyltransferase involved in LPS biosynthesis